MLKRTLSSFMWVLLLGQSALAEDPLAVSGYLKNFTIAFFQPSVEGTADAYREPDLGAVNHRLRIRLNLKMADWMSWFAAYDISPRIQDPSLFTGGPFVSGLAPGAYRFADLDQRLYPGEDRDPTSFTVFHNLDRLYTAIRTPMADIFIGRQAIAWGSGKIVNPTDVIAPFTFNELDTEERTGVDAIRVRIPLGMMDELDLGYVAGEDFVFDRSAFFLRGKINLLETDVSLLLLGFRSHLLLGLDFARSLGGAGFWCELAATWCDVFNDDNRPAMAKDYFRAAVGLDHNLGPTTYGFLEYHFSSAGTEDPAEYLSLLETTAFVDGSVYLLGRHYLGIGISQQISPLIPATGLLLVNLGDLSLTVAPQVEYNIAENIYLGVGIYWGIGKAPSGEEVEGRIIPTRLNSEFGTYPDMFYASFRVYF